LTSQFKAIRVQVLQDNTQVTLLDPVDVDYFRRLSDMGINRTSKIFVLLLKIVLCRKHTFEVVAASEENLAVCKKRLIVLELEDYVVKVDDCVESYDLP